MEKKRKKGKKKERKAISLEIFRLRAITRYVLSAFGKFVEIRFP